MKDWKIVVIFAAGAFFLSVTAGIIGGVSAGVILLRALAGGIIFGGFGYLLQFLLLPKFLPELLESGGDSGDTGVHEVSGSNVDIVIDDNEPAVDTAAAESRSTEEPDEFSESGGDVPETGVSMEEEAEISSGGASEIVSSEIETGDSGELPNIDAFSDVFNSVEVDADKGASLTGAVSVDIMGQQEDPGTVAKAIRTIMKKDQEG